jgi:hypothetical protein
LMILKNFLLMSVFPKQIRKIILNYLKSLRRQKIADTTIKNTVDILKFLFDNIRTDLIN